MTNVKRIAVLLSYYNGAEFIDEQLKSLLAQQLDEHVSVDIYIRDDGSTDSYSFNYLDEIKVKYPLVSIIRGSNLGVAQSFMHMLSAIDGYDYYAFCDQDDYWYADKISVGCLALSQIDKAALYCSSYELVDKHLAPLSYGHRAVNPTFYNSMFKNFCTGCTCIINEDLRLSLLNSKLKFKVPMHDWWFLLVAFCVGIVVFDPSPRLMYRQHGNNVVGGVDSFRKRAHRFFLGILNKKYIRSQLALDLHDNFKDVMPYQYLQFLNHILNSRRSFIARLYLFFGRNVAYPSMVDTLSVKILMLVSRY